MPFLNLALFLNQAEREVKIVDILLLFVNDIILEILDYLIPHFYSRRIPNVIQCLYD